jgi:GTP-binding protein
VAHSKHPFADAQFALSAQSLAQLPPDQGAEVAFVGRSNAGKSSAINALTGRKRLARTSKTPGCTRGINVYALDPRRRLMDLPGFGYARVADSIKRRWTQTISRYLQTRRCLAGLMLVMDIRHPLGPYDLELLHWCRDARLPVHILLTKADKLTRAKALTTLQGLQPALTRFGGKTSVQLFSAINGTGVTTASWRLAQWLDLPGAPSLGKKKPRKIGERARGLTGPGI